MIGHSSLAAAICLIASSLAAETVRVDVSSGVAQLVVNGRPVRARMFFGRPGSRPLRLTQEGREIVFEFTPAEDELDRSTMHLRFGQSAGTIFLDDICVKDLNARREVLPTCDFESGEAAIEKDWMIWPPGPANNVAKVRVTTAAGMSGSAGLQISLNDPPDGNWPDFHIYHRPNLALKKGHRYRVTLWARAEPARNLTVAFYRPGERFTFLGGPPSCFESQIKLAADVGVDFVSFPVHMPWPRPGRPVDWSTANRQCQTVLDANPRALLIPRIGMGAPRWWKDAHPDAVMVWDSGTQKRTDVVVASPDYLRSASARLQALVEHLEDRFGGRMAGYHPCGQNTGEWFYQETWGSALNGYSKASTEAWRRWLARRYDGDQSLQRAWNDPRVECGNAAIPTPAARRAAPAGLLRDPVAERPLIDFAEFQQEMMADCVCRFAEIVRQATRGRKLVVFFYGYVHEFGAVRHGPSTSGHYALRRVLESPDIDVLCSPISYFDRGLGQSGPAMTAAESVALAGKMWLVEDDTRTYLGSGAFPGWRDGVDTVEKTNQLLIRNTAQCAVRNFGTWWMDLGATGWFDDPRMWAEMDRLKAIDEPMLLDPEPYRPEVAAVVDERSMLRVAAGGDRVTRGAVYEARRSLGRMGAPYGQYLLDDVLAGRVQAKLYVFLNAWCLSTQQRQVLRDATRGAVTVWCYAPGYHEPERASLDAMNELTGFKFRSVTIPTAGAVPTVGGQRLGVNTPFSIAGSVKPLFAVAADTETTVLATYTNGASAVALKEFDHGTSIFVGPPMLTTDLLRLAAEKAGVHLFTDSDCNVYANHSFLVVHASQDGPVRIDTGGSKAIRNVLTGRVLARGPTVTLDLKKGDSRVLKLER